LRDFTLTGKYDVIIIGGGPAGYVAASRLIREGLKVALVEKRFLGGECTNWGCIPSKALIEASHVPALLKASRQAGIKASVQEMNSARVMSWVRRVRDRSRAGIAQLLSEAKIFEGTGMISGPKEVKVKVSDASAIRLEGSNIIVATGSDPAPVPGFRFDGEYVLSNRDFFELKELPSTMAVIGAGAIGSEIAAALARLGVKVHLIEIMDRVLPTYDAEVGAIVSKYLRRAGVNIHVATIAKNLGSGEGGVKLRLVQRDGGEAREITVDKVLIAAGRRYATHGIGLEEVGVTLGDKGVVVVNEDLRTSVPTILAAGDVTGPPLLAHKAFREGLIAAETVIHGSSSIPRGPIPSVIFTTPEVASVGLTEEQARSAGLKVRCVKYSYTAVSRDYTVLERTPEGFAKVVIEEGSGRILGASVVGNDASELIHALTLAVTLRVGVGELAKMVCAHPTYSEVVCELAHKAIGKPVHGG